ncbi:hypothetical protein LMG28614_05689 [Paraburkholderia ultramafica]|uniref:DUF1778 domain-containing protein n=1 Tax=Paraburkholderia ultramafica TaxID=1544867 RepID=A0A6S7BJR9_9BURK|nr:DUF1778 domain-containing protein [Paraburkholderia ultramafica]CAB3802753.1 hypothetical protein LMG28614_05689 [Paraburkholderia ultramafica]
MLPTDTHKSAKPAKAARTDRIDARLTTDQKELLEHAAALQGRTVTAFVLASAEEAALKTIREHETIRLSERDREAFIDALLNPPPPSKRLRAAAVAYLKEMGTA